MASFNKVILLGNLTRDHEVRYTPKGSAVCDLGIAVNRVYTTDSGERREEVTFVDVVLWARLAEIAGEYLKKGRPVFIEGRLQMDSWDDKQTGQKRTKLRAKIGKPVAPRPPHRRNHPPQLRRTKTKFRFDVARASGLRVLAASETLALRFHERDRSLHRAQYAANRWTRADAQIAGGF